MSTTLIYIIKAFILPPGSLIILLLLGLLCWRWSRRLAFICVLVATLLLYLLSLPIISIQLAKPLQKNSVLTNSALLRSHAEAIVVLGAGRYVNAPEYDGDTVSVVGLGRLRYAARLYKKTSLPILLSGGDVFSKVSIPEAELMKKALNDDFNIPVKWVENDSKNTIENAKFSAEILKDANIKSIYLVTDAVHMPRSEWLFRKYGISVVSAPTNFIIWPKSKNGLLGLFPSMGALAQSVYCLHEYIGFWWCFV
jgi:uncharacterized SAM-binding protein YcdF (DUF218 family)